MWVFARQTKKRSFLANWEDGVCAEQNYHLQATWDNPVCAQVDIEHRFQWESPYRCETVASVLTDAFAWGGEMKCEYVPLLTESFEWQSPYKCEDDGTPDNG